MAVFVANGFRRHFPDIKPNPHGVPSEVSAHLSRWRIAEFRSELALDHARRTGARLAFLIFFASSLP